MTPDFDITNGLESIFPREAFLLGNEHATAMSVAVLLFLQDAKQQDDWPLIATSPGMAHRWLASTWGINQDRYNEALQRVRAARQRIQERERREGQQ